MNILLQMKKLPILIVLLTGYTSSAAAGMTSSSLWAFPDSAHEPVLYQSSSAQMMYSHIPRGVSAPAFRRFVDVVCSGGSPTQQEFQALVAEYQNFGAKCQKLEQMYNQYLMSGNYGMALQISCKMVELFPLYSDYQFLINQYQLDHFVAD